MTTTMNFLNNDNDESPVVPRLEHGGGAPFLYIVQPSLHHPFWTSAIRMLQKYSVLLAAQQNSKRDTKTGEREKL